MTASEAEISGNYRITDASLPNVHMLLNYADLRYETYIEISLQFRVQPKLTKAYCERNANIDEA